MLKAIKNLYKNNAFYIAVLITVCIAVLSLFNVSQLKPAINLSNIDKYEHFLAYFTLTLSWFFAIQKSGKLVVYRFWLIMLVFLYGVLMEVLQQVLTDYRVADIYDVLANSSGIFFGVLFFEKRIRNEFKEFLRTSK
jgi:VanZ family protein